MRTYEVQVCHRHARFAENPREQKRMVPAEKVQVYRVRATSLHDAKLKALARFASELLRVSISGSHWLRQEERSKIKR
jgi:hypothetical protein